MLRGFLGGAAAMSALVALALAALPPQLRTLAGWASPAGEEESAGDDVAAEHALVPPIPVPEEPAPYEPMEIAPGPSVPSFPGRAVGPDDPGDDGALAAAVLKDWEGRTMVERNSNPGDPPEVMEGGERPGGACPRCHKGLTRVQPGMSGRARPQEWTEWLACPRHGIYWWHASPPGGPAVFRGPFPATDWPRLVWARRRAAACVDRLRASDDGVAASVLRALDAVGAEEILRGADPALARLRGEFVRPVQRRFRELAEAAATGEAARGKLLDWAWDAPLLARDEAAACLARMKEDGDEARIGLAGDVLAALEARLRDGRWCVGGTCPGEDAGHPWLMCCQSVSSPCARCGRAYDRCGSWLCPDCLQALNLCRWCHARVLPGSRIPRPSPKDETPAATRPPRQRARVE